MSNMIQIQHLTKHYKDVIAVNDLSFTVERGSIFAFLGVNGAGKSTTIHIMCTLLEKTSGRILIDDFNLDTQPEQIRRHIGIVFQENILDDLLSVGDNLKIRGQIQRVSGNALKTRLEELCRLLALEEIWKRPYGNLSGGQKRRCEIARALLGNPQLLILDEPTTGLDPQTRRSIWGLIRTLQKEQNMTVFLTTHYMEEAAEADEVVILEKGAICAQGTPGKLKHLYGQDSLRLRFLDMEYGKKQLLLLGLSPEQSSDVFFLPVTDCHFALKTLNALSGLLDFELVKGTMDDVFLNVTGRKGGAHHD